MEYFISDIPWPEEEEALSDLARSSIELLLTYDSKERPGAKGLRFLFTNFIDLD